MNKFILNTLALILILGLSGCSSKEDNKIKSLLKCSIAADRLGDYKAVRTVDSTMERYIANNASYFNSIKNISFYFMKLGEEVKNDDLGLSKYGTRGQIKVLKEAYSSDECQELYK